MSIAVLILGESGTGKTCSIRHFDPAQTLLIQPVRKPLPFRSAQWREGKGGNIFVSPDAARIIDVMQRAPHNIIIIDDWQYILASQYMSRRNERGFDKFTDIGGAGWDIAEAARNLPNHKRVYVLSHTATDAMGNVRIKTIGKMLDDAIVVEGLFTIVLRTHVDGASGRYTFLTQNNGHDTVKSPIGMFDALEIDNDLTAVDTVICDYYGLSSTQTTQE